MPDPLATDAPRDVHREPLVSAYQAHPVEHLEHPVFATDHACRTTA
jgi:hypothetical protein